MGTADRVGTNEDLLARTKEFIHGRAGASWPEACERGQQVEPEPLLAGRFGDEVASGVLDVITGPA